MSSASLECRDATKAFGGAPVLRGVPLTLMLRTVTALVARTALVSRLFDEDRLRSGQARRAAASPSAAQPSTTPTSAPRSDSASPSSPGARTDRRQDRL